MRDPVSSPKTFLLLPDHIWTAGGSTEQHAVLVEGNRIADVGPREKFASRGDAQPVDLPAVARSVPASSSLTHRRLW
ncbi:MAG TPA: hypothetical protein VHT03_05110 [Rhizomicrobium sp.]|jgi:hypothetical protein|nr:hypothetical protein [Rhizomicrobium sp.]